MPENRRSEHAGIPFLKTLGVRIKEIAPQYAEMTVTIDERHLNYMGGAHGGLIGALMDTVCFFPEPLVPSGRKVGTSELTISYLRAAGLGETLTARAELIHLGRRTASLAIRVCNQAEDLVAHGTARLMFLD